MAENNSSWGEWAKEQTAYDEKQAASQAIISYNPNTDDESKNEAQAASELYYGILDPVGTVYHGATHKPADRVKELQKVLTPRDKDFNAVASKLEVAEKEYEDENKQIETEMWSTLAGKGEMTDAEIAEYDADPSAYETKKRQEAIIAESKLDIVREEDNTLDTQRGKYDVDYSETSEEKVTRLREIKKSLEKQKMFIENMQSEPVNDYMRAAMSGTVGLTNIATGGIEVINSITKTKLLDDWASEMRQVTALYSEGLDISDARKKEWAKTEGEMWKFWEHPDKWSIMFLQSAPTMIASMVAGGVAGRVFKAGSVATGFMSKFPKILSLLDMGAYGAGSAAVNAAANTGENLAQAQKMGATNDEMKQIAQENFFRDFAMNYVVNSIQFGVGQGLLSESKDFFATKVLATMNNLAIGGTLEAYTELQESEIQMDALSLIAVQNIKRSDASVLQFIAEAMIDPKKRDVAVFAAVMSASDVVMGAYSKAKDHVSRTGTGVADVDLIDNFKKSELLERKQQIEKKREVQEAEIAQVDVEAPTESVTVAELDQAVDEQIADEKVLVPTEEKLSQRQEQLNEQFENKEYEIITENIDNIEQANYELQMLKGEKNKARIAMRQVKGILENADLDESTKAKLDDLLDPFARATGDEVNDTIKMMIGEPDDNSFQLRNEEIKTARELLDMSELTKAGVVTLQDLATTAKAQGLDMKALENAQKYLNSKHSKEDMSATERAGMLIRAQQIKQQIDALSVKQAELENKGKVESVSAIDNELGILYDDMDVILEAMSTAQSKAGLFLGSIRLKLDRFGDYTSAKQYAEKKSGRKLYFDQEEDAKDLFKEKAVLEADIKNLEEKEKTEKDSDVIIYEQAIAEMTAEAENFLTEQKADHKKSNTSPTLAEDIGFFEAVLSEKAEKVSSLTDLDPETKAQIGELAELYIMEIMEAGREPNMQELLERFKDILPESTDVQLLDAFSGRTKKKKAQIKDQYQEIETELKKQAVLEAKIIEALDNEITPFMPPAERSKIVNDLQDQLQGLKNAINKNTYDPAKMEYYQGKLENLQNSLADFIVLGEQPIQRHVKAEDHADIKAIKKEVANVQRKLRKEEGKGLKSNEAKIADLKTTIAKLKSDYEVYKTTGVVADKTKRPAEPEVVLNMRQEARELRALLNTEVKINEITKLVNQSPDNTELLIDFLKPKPRKQVANEALRKKKQQLLIYKRHIRGMMENSKKMHNWGFLDWYDNLMGYMTSSTLSGDMPSLRQGKYVMMRAPLESLDIAKDGLHMYAQTLIDPKDPKKRRNLDHLTGEALFAKSMQEIEADALFDEMQESKLAFTDPKFSLSNREEGFCFTQLSEKVPVLGRFVEGSEYMYSHILNKERVKYYKMLRQDGMSPAEKAVIARYVNTATGRGTIAKFEPSMVAMNKLLIAPRWYIANIHMTGGILLTDMVKNKTVMQAWLRDVASLAVSRAVMIQLGVLAGAKTSYDPEDALFGRLKMGKNVVDPWGGALWFPRLIAQSFANPKKIPQKLTKQVQYKLNVGINKVITALSGVRPTGRRAGEEWGVEHDKTVGTLELFSPMNIMTTNAIQMMLKGDIGDGVAQLAVEFPGGSIYSREDKKKKSKGRYKIAPMK